jgi:hypothetical protein
VAHLLWLDVMVMLVMLTTWRAWAPAISYSWLKAWHISGNVSAAGNIWRK